MNLKGGKSIEGGGSCDTRLLRRECAQSSGSQWKVRQRGPRVWGWGKGGYHMEPVHQRMELKFAVSEKPTHF